MEHVPAEVVTAGWQAGACNETARPLEKEDAAAAAAAVSNTSNNVAVSTTTMTRNTFQTKYSLEGNSHGNSWNGFYNTSRAANKRTDS